MVGGVLDYFEQRGRVDVVDRVEERTLLEKLYYFSEIYSLLAPITKLLINPFYHILFLLDEGIIVVCIFGFAELDLLIKHFCIVLGHI